MPFYSNMMPDSISLSSGSNSVTCCNCMSVCHNMCTADKGVGGVGNKQVHVLLMLQSNMTYPDRSTQYAAGFETATLHSWRAWLYQSVMKLWQRIMKLLRQLPGNTSRLRSLVMT